MKVTAEVKGEDHDPVKKCGIADIIPPENQPPWASADEVCMHRLND